MFLAALWLAMSPPHAAAQSAPNLRAKQVLLSSKWNSPFSLSPENIRCVGSAQSDEGVGNQCDAFLKDSIIFPLLEIFGKTIHRDRIPRLACNDLNSEGVSCSTKDLGASKITFGTPTAARRTTASIHPTGDTTDRSTAITAALSSYGAVILACGDYYVQTSILMPSNSSLFGAGPCTRLIGKPNLAINPIWYAITPSTAGRTIISNADFTNGNHNISIGKLLITTNQTGNNGHLVSFGNVKNVDVSNIKFNGGSDSALVEDCIGFHSKSSKYRVTRTVCESFRNAAYDNWGGSNNFSISNNVALGSANITLYGILVNGLGGTPGNRIGLTTKNFNISGNIILNTSNHGIGVFGLTDGSTIAYVRRGVISNNVIEGKTTKYNGIYVDEGSDILVSGNDVKTEGLSGIRIGSRTKGQAISNVTIIGNSISNSRSEGIYIGATARNVTINNSIISKTSEYEYAVRIISGATGTTIEKSNTFAAGRVGIILDAGALSRIVKP